MDKLHEASRKQFEEWIKFHSDEEECTDLLQRNSAGTNYLHPHSDLAWIAWKAARASIVVDIDNHTEFEIEHMISPEKEGYSIGWIDGRNYAANQVRSIGLSIKGE
ncbi:hypothetical protein [Serratia entomophila]|uniref:hypothetical protein n=1 Tax=Serratia entomophila TaxID=42906 RepID=UPI002177EB4F|nr:hypothetical protein [Serratia entomophila]CAI0827648.1 Uncharacterised protein [Serratia entomophila]CAI1656623.1 Uncharacterised protein [Serratia entomophila]CAI1785743.1 Uncharacterised protein [Serratia entomophila]